MREFTDPVGPAHLLRLAERLGAAPSGDGEALDRAVELDRAARRPFLARAGEIVLREGRPVSRLLIVVSGALVRRRLTRDGRCQVLGFHLPGDVLGAADRHVDHHTADTRTVTACRLAPLPPQWPDAPDARWLRAPLDALDRAERVVLEDRLLAVGRMTAIDRIAQVLLVLHARQRLAASGLGNRVWCPFSQSMLGDACGLTNVYVSKMLAQLEARGEIGRGGQTVELRDPAALAARIDFADRYAEIAVCDVGDRPAVATPGRHAAARLPDGHDMSEVRASGA